MDEIWQRHKTFILQCVMGGIVFLIALAIMSNAYSGADDPEELQRINASKRRALLDKVNRGNAPSARSIEAQKDLARQADEQIRKMAGEVASLSEGDEYVRESILWILENAGLPETSADQYMNLYRQLPQTALSRLREDARAALVNRTALDRVELDESLGIGGGIADDEVPMALHGLALTTDLVRRVLERNRADPSGKARVQSVRDLKVTPRNGLDKDLTWIAGLDVRATLVGDPDPVLSTMRSFNSLSNPRKRMTVVSRIDSITRPSADDDAVKATFTVLGLQHKGVKGAGR